MKYRHTPDLSIEIGRPTVRGRPIVASSDFERLGCGVFKIETRHGRIKNVRSDRIYLILAGQGRFTVAGGSFEVTKGDVVLVPRDTVYDYEGEMRLFLVHSPANMDEADLSQEEPPTIGHPPTPPDRVLCRVPDGLPMLRGLLRPRGMQDGLPQDPASGRLALHRRLWCV